MELQHDLGGGAFSRAGALAVKQAGGGGQGKAGRGGRLVLSRAPLGGEERAAFERLVQQDG